MSTLSILTGSLCVAMVTLSGYADQRGGFGELLALCFCGRCGGRKRALGGDFDAQPVNLKPSRKDEELAGIGNALGNGKSKILGDGNVRFLSTLHERVACEDRASNCGGE